MVPPYSDRISRVPPYSRTYTINTHTGLSPTMAGLSKPFCLDNIGHWPSPRSLATTNGVSVDLLSSGYLDVSVPRVCLIKLCIYLIIPFTDIQNIHTQFKSGAKFDWIRFDWIRFDWIRFDWIRHFLCPTDKCKYYACP